MNLASQTENVTLFLEGEIAPDPERRRALGPQAAAAALPSGSASLPISRELRKATVRTHSRLPLLENTESTCAHMKISYFGFEGENRRDFERRMGTGRERPPDAQGPPAGGLMFHDGRSANGRRARQGGAFAR